MLSLFLELLFPLLIAFAAGSLVGWVAMRIFVRPVPASAPSDGPAHLAASR
ncbi:MAG: hypothetical protein QM655_13140 [Nocardioidaceae bacterium]